MFRKPSVTNWKGQKQYRIIPSKFPPINFFEELVDASEMEILFDIESLTNERLRQEAGDIFLVPAQDRVCGPGSSVIMAAFTHIYCPSRFSDGTCGVYYAGLTLQTSMRETVYHRERFMQATQEEAGDLMMRVYEGKIIKPLHDLRNGYPECHNPDSYIESQSFGKQLKELQSWGVIYASVRHHGGTCIAAFRPAAISIPQQTKHLIYKWDGQRITTVLDAQVILEMNPL